jgi:hypothetical protein
LADYPLLITLTL